MNTVLSSCRFDTAVLIVFMIKVMYRKRKRLKNDFVRF